MLLRAPLFRYCRRHAIAAARRDARHAATLSDTPSRFMMRNMLIDEEIRGAYAQRVQARARFAQSVRYARARVVRA